jgi:hypothetical protein
MVLHIKTSNGQLYPLNHYTKSHNFELNSQRMTMQMGDGRVFGTLIEYRHCGMTQNLRLTPCNPEDGKELDDENIFIEWQSKCRCFDCAMIYCGCKSDYDCDNPMVIDDKKGHK